LLQVAGQGLIRCFVCGNRRDTAQIHDLGLRRITQTGIGTALEAHLELTGSAGRDLQFQTLAVNLLLTKELVTVRFAFRQDGMLVNRQTIELQAFLIKVIAVGDLPIELGFTGFKAFGGEDKRLFHRQEFRFGIERIAPCLGHTRDQEDKK
jgi:hypothetical protein